MSDVWNISNSDLLNLYQTDMEIDVMKRIIDTLPRAVDVWSMYRDRRFRSKMIDKYWAERLE
jgi:bifunctional pyridoxal-dependent enzyme with beta-cystathionase and maltose regulon repressor activities